MFLPTRIAHIYERPPIVTSALIGVNAVLFIAAELWMADSTWLSLALRPAAFAPHQLLTHAFLHVGFLHVAGNMLFLAVYGRYVEERMGHLRYLGAYVACAIAGAVAYLASGDSSPAVGASGAISGLMGFVLVAAPWAEVEMLFLLGPLGSRYWRSIRIAAFWLILPWIAEQLLVAASGIDFGVAISAHLGGCAAGAALGGVLRSDRMRGTAWYVDPAPPGGGVASTRRLRRSRGAPRAAPAAPQHAVVLERVDEAPSLVALVKLLMASRDLSPTRAKELVDAVAAGTPIPVPFPDSAAADAFALRARELGAQVTIVRPTPPGRAAAVARAADAPGNSTSATASPPSRTGFELEPDDGG